MTTAAMVPAPRESLRYSATDAMVRSAAGGDGGTAPDAAGAAVGLGVDVGAGVGSVLPDVAVRSAEPRTV